MATKARSPNYPAISLRKAVELASKLYNKAHTNKAPAAVVAEALGYNGLNGASLGVISALKKYGLLEAAGDEFRVSKEGLSIIVDPKTSTARAEAIMRAAFRPALFAELRQEYGDKPPTTDEFLRAFLLKRGFVQSVVEVPIRAYRDTMTLVEEAQAILGPAAKVGDLRAVVEDDEEEAMNQATLEAEMLAERAPQVNASVLAPTMSGDVNDDVYKLTDGRAFVLRWPAKLTAEEFEDFESWITLLQRKLKRQIEQ